MANINYQIVINMFTAIFTIVTPISLIFLIVDKITNWFLAFVGGKDVHL